MVGDRPAAGTLDRGATVTFSWTPVAGAGQYLFEFLINRHPPPPRGGRGLFAATGPVRSCGRGFVNNAG